MTVAKSLRILLPLTWVFACLPSPAMAQTAKRLWVLTEPDSAIEYDTAAFSVKRTVKIPAEACKNPRSFAVNGKGQMLLDIATGARRKSPVRVPDADHVFLR
jgi:hypothetical protein